MLRAYSSLLFFTFWLLKKNAAHEWGLQAAMFPSWTFREQKILELFGLFTFTIDSGHAANVNTNNILSASNSTFSAVR